MSSPYSPRGPVVTLRALHTPAVLSKTSADSQPSLRCALLSAPKPPPGTLTRLVQRLSCHSVACGKTQPVCRQYPGVKCRPLPQEKKDNLTAHRNMLLQMGTIVPLDNSC